MRTNAAAEVVRTRPVPRHPLSRWYVGPVAERFARRLERSRVRPVHLTAAGLLAAVGAVVVLAAWPSAGPWAALLVGASWFFDRADGLLARRQGTSSAWGAWLDANVDELVDVGLHTAVASAAARLVGSQLPWFLLIAFLAGKYLFYYGLTIENSASENSSPSRDREGAVADRANCNRSLTVAARIFKNRFIADLLRRCYHLPGDADIRVHLLILALLTGWLTAELALVAAYYNFRWVVRYVLVARRLGGVR
ncbi:MAG TPA: CDP-alcohol phosphatidyltransferase family protein [Thermoguttaceae bacterium]|nr:CDP-alcohol phosphatidyltransferase family protein [Thermoguttaceae bacterium]